MSQDLHAIIGEQQVELRQLRAQKDEIQKRYDELSQFVHQAATTGTPIRLVDQSECQSLPPDFALPQAPPPNPDAEPLDVKYTPAEELTERDAAEPALSH